MAPWPPLKPDQQANLRSRAAMLASTAMARIGFGLTERAASAEPASGAAAPTIPPAQVSLRIEDGLLMAFGPDGDPIPPGAFAALAAAQPDAGIALDGGSFAPAGRVAAVLEAQAKGRLAGQPGDPVGGEAWIEAMLGLGPQPVLAGVAELRGEDATCELTIFGHELMLGVPDGRRFLIADADSGPQGPTMLALLAGGQALSVGDLALRLRAEIAERPPANVEPGGVHPIAEVLLSGCAIERTPDGLRLELPAVGAVRLTTVDQQVPAGPRVRIVLQDGQPAELAEVTAALGLPQGRGSEEGLSAPPDQPPAHAQAGAPEPADAALPVSLALPRVEGVDADRIVVVIVRGLPAGGALSAGIDDGDGRWVLSPRQLRGLRLTAPPGRSEPLSLEVTAVGVRNRAGELATASNTVTVALDAPAETVVPLAIDPALVRDSRPAPSALMIRALPPGARLSAGTYDPATDGWVLRPDQLESLTIAMPLGQGDFTLTVLGISLAAGGRAEARLLARLPVAAP
jgi:hypothetical protein